MQFQSVISKCLTTNNSLCRVYEHWVHEATFAENTYLKLFTNLRSNEWNQLGLSGGTLKTHLPTINLCPPCRLSHGVSTISWAVGDVWFPLPAVVQKSLADVRIIFFAIITNIRKTIQTEWFLKKWHIICMDGRVKIEDFSREGVFFQEVGSYFHLSREC